MATTYEDSKSYDHNTLNYLFRTHRTGSFDYICFILLIFLIQPSFEFWPFDSLPSRSCCWFCRVGWCVHHHKVLNRAESGMLIIVRCCVDLGQVVRVLPSNTTGISTQRDRRIGSHQRHLGDVKLHQQLKEMMCDSFSYGCGHGGHFGPCCGLILLR